MSHMSIFKLSKSKPDTPDLSRVLNAKKPGAIQRPPADDPTEIEDGCDTWNQVIITAPGGFHQEGILLEVSEEEAHLRFMSRTSVPERIEVKIPRLGTTKPATVRLQDGQDVYVDFVVDLDEPCKRLGKG